MADPASVLGDFIRRQREVRALSMRQFADMAGISNPYLSQIERGLRAPSDTVLQAIAATLQTSAATLRADAGVPTAEKPPSRVIEAIGADERLTGSQRRALLEVYKAFTA
jgi:transcriptional regulator with XRE-family HTH domain